MKAAEEYLRANGISMIDYNHSADYPSSVKAVKQAQKEAYNQALEDCLSKALPPAKGWMDAVLVEAIKKLKLT